MAQPKRRPSKTKPSKRNGTKFTCDVDGCKEEAICAVHPKGIGTPFLRVCRKHLRKDDSPFCSFSIRRTLGLLERKVNLKCKHCGAQERVITNQRIFEKCPKCGRVAVLCKIQPPTKKERRAMRRKERKERQQKKQESDSKETTKRSSRRKKAKTTEEEQPKAKRTRKTTGKKTTGKKSTTKKVSKKTTKTKGKTKRTKGKKISKISQAEDGVNVSELIRRTGRGKMTKKQLEKKLREIYAAHGRDEAWIEKRIRRCLWRTKNFED